MATNSKKYYDEVLQTATKSGANAVQAQQAAAEAVNKKYGGLGTTSSSAPAVQTKTANKAASSRPAYTQSQNVTNAYNRVNSLTNSKPLPYKQSQAVSDAYNKLTALDGSKPSPYSSNYSDQINSLLNEITGRDKFTYNADSDPLYNQYKDKYTAMGKQAMQDTMGNAAALTGGYGSSYASTAGNQAYQAYLGQLNDKLPELYQLALDKYNNETNDMYNRMNLLQGLDNTDYGRYRDTVGDYYTDVSNAENRYNMLYNQDYGKYRDNMSDYYPELATVTLPSGTTYQLIDEELRALVDTLTSATVYLGTTTTAINDGSTTNTIVIGEETITAKAGNIVNYGNSEFIWSDIEGKWRELGSTGSLKALAFKDSASASYKPAGTVSAPEVSVAAKTAAVKPFGSAGTLPSCTLPTLEFTVTGKTLKIDWSAGSFNKGTLPTAGTAVNVVTKIESASATAPTFTGTSATITVK